MSAQEKRLKKVDSGKPGSAQDVSKPSSADAPVGKPRGVIRNLMDGHYKGVADLRLRINFSDELTELEQSQQVDMISERTNNLLGQTLEKLSETAEMPLSTEQQQAVDNLAEDLTVDVENLLGGESSKSEDFLTDLQAVFEEFASALKTSLSSEPIAAVEPTKDGDVTDGEVSAITETPPQAFMDELQSSFVTAFATLKEELSSLSLVPELSGHKNQGAAYEKFLSIYQSMSGDQPASSADSTASPDAAGPAEV
jgi:hypothetical protein